MVVQLDTILRQAKEIADAMYGDERTNDQADAQGIKASKVREEEVEWVELGYS